MAGDIGHHKHSVGHARLEDVARAFYQGRLVDVATYALRQDGSVCRASDAPYFIAALAAVGRSGEAEAFAATILPYIPANSAAFALAHLAMSAALTSVPRSLRFLHELVRLTKRSQDPECRFWTLHSAARIRFAQGRFQSAAALAPHPFKEAAPYVRYAAHELQAQCLVPQARLEEAVEHFESASAAARTLGHGAALAGLDLARWLAASRYAPEAPDALSTEALRVLSPLQRASYLLEAARRLAVDAADGDPAKLIFAEAALAGTAEPIASSGSARFEIAFALRRIDFHLARGESAEARISMRRLAASVHHRADPVLALDVSERFFAAGERCMINRDLLLKHTGYVPPLAPKLAAKRLPQFAPSASAVAAQGFSPANAAEFPAELNLRQIEMLRAMRAGDAVDVHAYRKRFDVAEITASRDLARLTALDLLARIGKARATRYVKCVPKSLLNAGKSPK